MDGFVPTPPGLATDMVATLFADNPPTEGDRILYPGVGTGPFVTAVTEYCNANNYPVPGGVGVDIDENRLETARNTHESVPVTFRQLDFLDTDTGLGSFEYIVGNPPYVSIENLDESDKQRYQREFTTASGRFDLYFLFFEQALSHLADGGRLVFVTPEKFEYVEAASDLRELLASYDVEAITHALEDVFEGYITYPTITTLTTQSTTTHDTTSITRRDGSQASVSVPTDGSSWAGTIRQSASVKGETVPLSEVCSRISCGVATGNDSVFVRNRGDVPEFIREFIVPTVSGSELTTHEGPYTDSVFISAYTADGELRALDQHPRLKDFLDEYRDELEDRYCVYNDGKAWYAWHETPPMQAMLQPKLVWQDVSESLKFYADSDGTVVPRHSVYYLIPKPGVSLDNLQTQLNSPETRAWLAANCQRAANGFLRLQSSVLKDLPVPKSLSPDTD